MSISTTVLGLCEGSCSIKDPTLVRLRTVRWHKDTEKNDQFLEELEESFGWKHTPRRSPRVEELSVAVVKPTRAALLEGEGSLLLFGGFVINSAFSFLHLLST